ncbi:MAG: hypothetical protein COV10_02760 [Candidatus Vogelbacteria bacterium CG10_big_fil_rev_8_21_14_0_10_51_16]|uniref:Cell shape-determining protein MreC n=1 Tax=Candidatus Vogelbacteria bacterium CG10_big_fil_rev_8_21_14_0_10_51_16 TaxID=1975045 RepID=A0A2H0REB6_9BACT|nr:MAG: hypothetical protein COV10_02760 [Candidatus Vogelbacteria bacterium CG10_big_fil_rev_8_21_14_0_10_51_16]
MTNFLLNKKRTHRSTLTIALVLGIMLLLSIPMLRTALGGVLITVADPIWRGGITVSRGAGIIGSFFRDRTILGEDLRVAREKAALVAEKEALVKALQADNTALRALLGRHETLESETAGGAQFSESDPIFSYLLRQPILALILSRPVLSAYDTLVVDRGSVDGVSLESAVFSRGGTILGVVDDVYAHHARVLLLSAPGRRTAVLLGAQHLAATAVGAGGGTFRVTVARGVNVVVGDTVQLLNDEPWVLGTVALVTSEDGSALDTIHVKSSVNFNEMKWVVVGKDLLPSPPTAPASPPINS